MRVHAVRRALLIGALLALLPAIAAAQTSVVTAQGVSYIVFEQITVANTAIGFTATKVEPDGSGGGRQATVASCRVRTAEISFTYDNTAPTTTVGQLAEIGDQIVVSGHDSIMRFKAIRTGATSGQLDCVYTQ